MTDSIIKHVNGFDESSFDAELDSRWRDFRIRLADLLADLMLGLPFAVHETVSPSGAEPPQVTAIITDDGRLRTVIEIASLAAASTDRASRVALLRGQGWLVHGDDTLILDFDERHVDAAAVAVEYAFRQVWDVPDPAYLAGASPAGTQPSSR
ncbi:TY-Chap domain-containing protein [Gordonia humi]|uniref:TY-Chap N-terminal domain-containing protein n=1 Tax=Gordonia humi TaxID=686429 RepID=A0A840EVQ0_9ACTN|nr:hypothetical protein [Gordonia humi]MBB4133916.1 hypothetical protein [Gordonia humi]